MNIGIVVYSQTGNTFEVAQKLQESLLKAGNWVNIERINVANEKERDINKIEIINGPDISKYDALIFGSPVHAFSLSSAMTAFMSQIPSLEGKKVSCFVTKGLPLKGTGGNQAISKMKNICESKTGDFCGSEIVIWNKDKEKQITKLSEEMCRFL
jgi:flavodoxin